MLKKTLLPSKSWKQNLQQHQGTLPYGGFLPGDVFEKAVFADGIDVEEEVQE